MFTTAMSGEDSAGQRILNKLETMERFMWKSIVKRVAIIKLTGYKRICKDNGRIKVKIGTNFAKMTNQKVRRFRDSINLVIH